MAYVEHVALTRAQFAALVGTGNSLDRPVWFRITDALAGEPVSYLGVPGQTATLAGVSNQAPRVTSAERDAMRAVARGTLIFNLTTDAYEYFSLSGWTLM